MPQVNQGGRGRKVALLWDTGIVRKPKDAAVASKEQIGFVSEADPVKPEKAAQLQGLGNADVPRRLGDRGLIG